jgi:4-amino-4-deoxy-L-arabinose transferase-like glycosyltransferase
MTAEAKPVPVTARSQKLSLINYAIVAVALFYIAFALLYRLDKYPAPHFDEGAFLKVAKNYALHGVYADFSDDGNRFTGPVVSTGPTVILPISLLFKLFGVSIPLARLSSVAYAFLMLAALYALGTRLSDQRLAFLAVLLVVANPIIEIHRSSRISWGEIPALLFLLVGLGLWLFPGNRRQILRLIGTGILFGLACITKAQWALFIFPGIGLAWVLDLVWYRRRGWLHFVVPGAVAALLVVAWTYYVLFLLGAQERNVAQDLAHLQSLGGVSLVILKSETINTNLEYLLNKDPFFIPVMLYGLVLALRKDDSEQRWSTIFLFLLTSTVMFLFSVGWPRYAIPSRVFDMLLLARIVSSLTNGLRLNWQELQGAWRGKELSVPIIAKLVIMGLLLGAFVRPTYLQLKTVATEGDDSPYRLAQYLNENVPQGKLIETWQPELGVLTNHTYHFPPYSIPFRGLVELYPDRADQYRDWVKADYIVLIRETHIPYLPEQLAHYELTFSVGDYEVYRRKG